MKRPLAHLALAAVLLASCTAKAATVPPPVTPSSSSSTIERTITVAATTKTTTEAPSTTTLPLLQRIVANPTSEVAHAFPIASGVNASYAHTHGEYPATDVFADCGTEILAMATGVVQHVRRVDTYNAKTDNPALRGGKSVSVVGFDAVRYYTSHLDRIDVVEGQPVKAGDVLGTIGLTGDSEACHTHVGLSPLCPTTEWSVRRGVIWPWPYLDVWRRGDEKQPASEITSWLLAHPATCSTAEADPNATD